MSEMNEHNTRRLDIEEVTREGDEYQSCAKGKPWVPIDSPGTMVDQHLDYRRRIMSTGESEIEKIKKRLDTLEGDARTVCGRVSDLEDETEKRLDSLEDARKGTVRELAILSNRLDALENKGLPPGICVTPIADSEENEGDCYFCKHFSGNDDAPCPLWPCGNKWEPKQDAP